MAVFGCIADDFTGATDIAGILTAGGMRTLVVLKITQDVKAKEFDAIVVALKSRTAPVADAVQDSLQALHWLQEQGCTKFHFKYCSTFDSRPTGNIGPVLDALLSALESELAVVCPAFPANGRTVYQGTLFVWDKPLDESTMKDHPLTPMRDSNLSRLLRPQTCRSIGLVRHQVVSRGASAIQEELENLRARKIGVAIVDAIYETDLVSIAKGSTNFVLTTGASGLALGIPKVLREAGFLQDTAMPSTPRNLGYREVILSGSCSSATLEQVREASRSMPVFRIDALGLARTPGLVNRVVDWFISSPDKRVLISASSDLEAVRQAQETLGADRAGEIVEQALAAIAKKLVKSGVRKIIVAGGETSGAVTKALQVDALHMGKEIDPGVNWAFTSGQTEVALALKSGNFGSPDFFTKAWEVL